MSTPAMPMPSSLPQPFHLTHGQVEAILNSTLGPTLIGGLAAAMFLGVSTIQTIHYFRLHHADGIRFRLMIFGLWLLDLLHMAFIAHALYFYFVTNYANIRLAFPVIWSLFAMLIITSTTSLTVRLVFAHRLWKVTGGSILFTLPPVVTAIFTYGTSVAFAIKGLQLSSFLAFGSLKWLLVVGFSVGAGTDALLVLAMLYALRTRYTGFAKTDSLINQYIFLCVNAGVFTSLSSLLVVVTYAAVPDKLVFLAFFFVLNPIFLNALLVSLNWRDQRLDERSRPGPGLAKRDSERARRGALVLGVKRTRTPDLEHSLAIKIETETHQCVDDRLDAQWNAAYVSYMEGKCAGENIKTVPAATFRDTVVVLRPESR